MNLSDSLLPQGEKIRTSLVSASMLLKRALCKPSPTFLAVGEVLARRLFGGNRSRR